MDAYEAQQKSEKYQRNFQYYFAMVLKGLMYIVTMVTKLLWQVTKGVLKTFGVPIH